jgi:hypothetical protein
MVLELGPLPADDLRHWARFARRVVVELRTKPEDLQGIATDDFLNQWTGLIDAWCTAASSAPGQIDLRWSATIDDEMAEFLLHGLERCFYSRGVTALLSPDDLPTQRRFTLRIIQAFVDGLASQGDAHDHYVDQVRASFGGRLD